jgi:hypothetical protein
MYKHSPSARSSSLLNIPPIKRKGKLMSQVYLNEHFIELRNMLNAVLSMEKWFVLES